MTWTLSQVAVFLSERCGVPATRSSVLRTATRLELPVCNSRLTAEWLRIDVREFRADLV